MSYLEEKQTAVEAVTVASRLCTAIRSEMVRVDSVEKGDRSPVTIADFGAQALVCRHLAAAFPGDPIVAEEDAAWLRAPEHADRLALVTDYVRRFVSDASQDDVCNWIDTGNGEPSDRYWTLDPIDGTKGFLRNDQYAVALALIENGEVQVGVLGCPALAACLDDPDCGVGVLFVAVRGEGAYMGPLGGLGLEAVRVASATDEAHLRFVESVESGHGNTSLQEAVAQRAGVRQPPLKLDSQVKYGCVARGDAALYLRFPSPRHTGYREKIWDHAAGSLIVQEAGGRVSDMQGRPLDFASGQEMMTSNGMVVSNGVVHDAVLEALAAQ